jgi:glutamate-5-semialdehyde dehydrogenase
MSTDSVLSIAQQSRAASRQLAATPEFLRNQALANMAEALASVRQQVLEINAQEIIKARDEGQTDAMVKRLAIDDKTFDYMLSRIKKVAQLPDPLNRILTGHTNPAGLRVYKKSVPLGVIGIIYEARPNVTVDSAALCLKTGNAVILRGGSESFHSSTAIHGCLVEGLRAAGLPDP